VRSAEVCLLDDDPNVLIGVGRLLSSANWDTQKFSDPQEFLRYSEAHQPPVAVIDICMPIMSELEVQSRLREISPPTRVIIFTGDESELHRVAALCAGAVAFFNKPVDNDEFLAAVRDNA